jgi:hypothetical protein
MTVRVPTSYLSGLTRVQREALASANRPGLTALLQYLDSDEAVAFLGAGVSAPLYPLWQELIVTLIAAAEDQLGEEETATCRALAAHSAEAVVEIVRRRLGEAAYWETLREVLRARSDPETGRSWTPVQELVCRCKFKGIVTTNYDPGIVNALMRVRPDAIGTGFTVWPDDLGLDRWRTGKVFGDIELPVLYAHGQHNQPDSVVLSATDYGRAYAGKLPHVLGHLIDSGHLVWIGFSFADQRIAAILREIALKSGTKIDPGTPPNHVAIMPWDPRAVGNDPRTLAQRAEIDYGARVILYPATDDDHSALERLLADFTDSRFQPAPEVKTQATTMAPRADLQMPVTWIHGAEEIEHFTGRTEELARIDRWAADRQVKLVGVTAWGGAGKTALVVQWVRQGGPLLHPEIRGVFAWSFYSDPSANHWAAALLKWAAQEFHIETGKGRPATEVMRLLRDVPLLVILDGLEVMQEGPAGSRFGGLLDGILQEVLTYVCMSRHHSLVMLTSRFPFADLEAFDGSTVRLLEVPAFTLAEGSALLDAAGADWLGSDLRREVVSAVDGHALAVGVLAGALASRPPISDLTALLEEFNSATRTSARVIRVLRFYSKRLGEPHRYLVAAVSLFPRPIPAETIIAVSKDKAFGDRLAGWTPAGVIAEVRDRLSGLISVLPDGTLSAHPLVRDTFRPLVMEASEIAADIVLAGLPGGQLSTRQEALQLIEVIEMLTVAGKWQAADQLYIGRTKDGELWTALPLARLGQRAAMPFVATPERRAACSAHLTRQTMSFYLDSVGLDAMLAGDLLTAEEYLRIAISDRRDVDDQINLIYTLGNLVMCLGYKGEMDKARAAAEERLAMARSYGAREDISSSHAFLGWLAGLSGETSLAEEHFLDADRYQRAASTNPIASRFAMSGTASDVSHLNGLPGILWADWLFNTGRNESALILTQQNKAKCQSIHWNADIARCDRMLGRLAIAAGDTVAATGQLQAAASCFRDGDLLTELATALVDLAECARLAGDLDAATQYAEEAIGIAASRGLIPTQSYAHATRARILANRAASTHNADQLAQGRDAADTALRLATHHHRMWCELEALRTHTILDGVDNVDSRWAGRTNSLHSRLVPPGLELNPLAP